MEPVTEYLLILLVVLIVFAGLQMIKLYHFIKDLKTPPVKEVPQVVPEEYRPKAKSSPRPKKKSVKKTAVQKKKQTKKGKTRK